ncbi:hypothetical protein D3C75_704710 [compost metagenome]
MVGQVDHRGIDLVLLAAQGIDQRGQHLVGIGQGVVVPVDDFLLAALVQRVALAHRGEALAITGVALEVLGAVAAHLVQHQHGVLVEVVDQLPQALQQDLVMAFTISAQLRVLEFADIDELHAVAGALAARLVVTPLHRQAGTLEDVQQPFAVLRHAGIVVLALHAREHAWHRNGGFRAAGVHIGERQQALFPGKVRCGIAVVAKHAEVVCPRTFAHHQHGQRLAFVLLPGSITLGIFAIMLEGPRCGTDALADITNGGTHDIAGGEHQAQFVVVAKQRRQALVVDQCHRAQGHHAGTANHQLAEQFTVPGAIGDRRLPQQHRRHYTEAQDIQGKLQRKQVTHFRHVGFRDIAEHARVNKYAVLVHEVSHTRATHEQHDKYWLQYITEGEQREDQVEREQHQHGKRQAQPKPRQTGRHDLFKMLPEEDIEADQQVKAGQQRDPFSPQGFEVEHQCSQSRVIISPRACAAPGKLG